MPLRNDDSGFSALLSPLTLIDDMPAIAPACRAMMLRFMAATDIAFWAKSVARRLPFEMRHEPSALIIIVRISSIRRDIIIARRSIAGFGAAPIQVRQLFPN